MKNCLVISAHVPSSRALEAGHKVAYFNIELISKSYSVDLFLYKDSLSSIELEDLKKITSNIIFNKFNIFSRLRGILFNFFSITPRFATRLDPFVINKLKKLIASKEYDLIHFEFSQASAIVKKITFKGKKQAVLHDIQLQVVLRSDHIYDKLATHSVYNLEKSILDELDEVYVLSQKDKYILENLYSSKNVSISSPRFSDFVYKVERKLENIEPNSLLFWGAMNRPENHDAVINFIDNVFPSILSNNPDVKLYVVGNMPPKKLQAYHSKNIIVTGFVENPASYFEIAALGIVPLLRGAGIKVKVLEMLAAGLPVVSTSIGAEGISHEKLIECSIDSFADNIINSFNINKVGNPLALPGRQ